MGLKRFAEEADITQARSLRQATKRTKLTPTAEADLNSSDPSSCSVSEDSALQSSPPASRKTSLSSVVESGRSDAESESSRDSSESETDTDEEYEAEIVTLGGPKKPQMTHSNVVEGAQDLQLRLDALLPQLAASNQLLTSSEGLSMEDVEEGKQHIEMNLGLGVLEEKGEDESSSASEESDVSEDEELEDEDAPVSSSAVERPRNGGRSDVMTKLLGQPKGRQKVGIEDLGLGSSPVR